MKLDVQGIEEIEITDPAGLCNPPAQQGIPIQQQPRAILPKTDIMPLGLWPTPQVPTPSRPVFPLPGEPKWGVGGSMIQQAGQQVQPAGPKADPEKWEKNWQSKISGEGPGNGNRSTP